jgi:multidrug efflux system outer membrane protein
LDPASQSWNLFAGLLQPIFEGGKNTARVEMRESQQRQALHAYKRALLQALREVEDALVGLRSAAQQRVALRERVTAERKVLELSDLRYKGGVSDYLIVLDAQRSLFDAEIDEVAAATFHAQALIRLYKALGGGWPAEHGKNGAPGQAPPAGAAPATPAPTTPAPGTPAPATSAAAPPALGAPAPGSPAAAPAPGSPAAAPARPEPARAPR